MKPNSMHATIDLLASTWPKCFAVKPLERRPLKVGIAKDIAAVAEGAITPEELTAALNACVGHKRYQQALREGAARVDLDGNPASVVTANEAAYARLRVEWIDARNSAQTRARGLAAEAAKRAAEETRRAVEIAAGKRKPLLRLPQSVAA